MPTRSFAPSTASCSSSTTSCRDAAAIGPGLPALEYCLKCSHLFNLLDSSGSIGVTERTAYILRVRQLAVALRRRGSGETEGRTERRRAARIEKAAVRLSALCLKLRRRTSLLIEEIGVEESRQLAATADRAVAERLEARLKELRMRPARRSRPSARRGG